MQLMTNTSCCCYSL